MKLKVSQTYSRVLARGAAVALAGGLATGCSSDITRFQGGLFTGSTQSNQQAAAGAQSYPGDVDRMATGSISSDPAGIIPGGRVIPKGGVGEGTNRYNPYAATAYPVQPSQYPAAPVRQAIQPATVGIAAASAVERRSLAAPSAAKVDKLVTGSTTPVTRAAIDVASPAAKKAAVKQATAKAVEAAVKPAVAPVEQIAKPVAAAATEKNGWTATGGTLITLREGETIYNLSKRFGVPADAIMRVNGISNPRDVTAGEKVVIPTYVYSSKGGVSSPDHNPDTKIAKSSRGTQFDTPASGVPQPSPAPKHETVAVLPQTPRTRETVKPVESNSPASKGLESGEAGAKPEKSAAMPAQTKPVAAAKSAGAGGYTVASGDSLYAIAKRNGITVADLKAANGLSGATLRVGQKLVIPGATTGSVVASAQPVKQVDPIITGSAGPSKKTAYAPTAKAADTAKVLPTYTPPTPKETVIKEAEKSAEAAPDATGVGKMRWPVRGRVVSSFGSSTNGKANDGIDISVPMGTPVKAAENGVVIYAGDGLKEYGNTVLVRHEDGLVSVYGHNSALNVKRGDKVSRGQEIAKAGTSGSTDSPKLHFEVRKNSAPVNPSSFLE